MQKSRGNSPHLHHVEAPPYVSSLLLQTARQTAGFSFFQKSFATQNLFGSPDRLWCPRCVFHTPKSTTSGQGYFVHRCYCNGLTYEPALPFSQKSFAFAKSFREPLRKFTPYVSGAPKTVHCKTDGGLLLFPVNLLLCKIFSGT